MLHMYMHLFVGLNEKESGGCQPEAVMALSCLGHHPKTETLNPNMTGGVGILLDLS